MTLKLKEKASDNHSNVKTETTKQSDQTNSSMTGSSSTNTVVGLKRIAMPYKTKLSHSKSKKEVVRQTIQRESIQYSLPQRNKKQLSPKYASNTFNTFYASHSTNNINVNTNNHKSIFTNTNQSKFTSGKSSTNNIFKSGTQIRIISYYSKYLTQKGNS